jgi:hypothetical protein
MAEGFGDLVKSNQFRQSGLGAGGSGLFGGSVHQKFQALSNNARIECQFIPRFQSRSYKERDDL